MNSSQICCRVSHRRNVFNRVAAAINEGADEWTLLRGLIDDDTAYVTERNPNWTTYRDVAAVAQTCWGPADEHQPQRHT